MVELWERECDALVFLQTIEHVQDPDAVLRHFRDMLAPGGAAYVSTPNLLTLAPEGAEKSDNPWHIKEYRAHEFKALCERSFGSVELYGLFHARKLRVHELAIRGPAGTRSTRPCGSPSPSTTASPRRSRPATSRSSARTRPTSTARWTSSRSSPRERRARPRPALPHALRRGLRDLAVRRGVAVGGDRRLLRPAARRARRGHAGHGLDHAGARRPARRPGRARALPGLPARRAARDAPPRHRLGRGSRRRRRARARRRGSTPRGRAAGESIDLRRRAARRARAGPRRPRTRCCRSWPPAPACGCRCARGSRPTAGASSTGTAASGCPSARTRRGSSRCSRPRGCARSASSTPTSGSIPAGPLRTDAGLTLVPIDRAVIDLVWSEDGYPCHPAYRAYGGLTEHRHRAWANDGSALRREPGGRGRARARRRLRRPRRPSGWPAAACACSPSTPSCSATGGTRGRRGWPPCSARPTRPGCRSSASTRRSSRPTVDPAPADLPVTTWGKPRTLWTWSGPQVADLAWAARAAELRTVARARDLGAGAARELLALQASDWAFLATADTAGPYPRERAAGHLERLDELARRRRRRGGAAQHRARGRSRPALGLRPRFLMPAVGVRLGPGSRARADERAHGADPGRPHRGRMAAGGDPRARDPRAAR